MNESTCQSLFFISLPDLRKLCAVTVVLNPGDAVLRDLQLKICRYLLFQYQDVVSSPVPGEQNKILVIMAIAFYKSGKLQAAVEKHWAKMEVPQRVTAAMLQTCLSYTLTAKLAPSWNKAGHLFIQGKDFLSQTGKQCAVVMDLNVSDTQLCISLQVFTVRLPPPQLVDFDISAGALKTFENNKNFVILRHFISSNWCYVLPSMKMGQIVSISHSIPPDSPFLSYENFQAHWKNLYGYMLPEDQGENMIYCSVFFKLIGERLFTYPFSCIRSKPVQFFPRMDLDHVLNAFLSDLKFILSHLCGCPVKMTSKPCYATKELIRPCVQDIQCRPTNLTAKAIFRASLTQFPFAKISVSAPESLACTAGYEHKMGPLINQSRAYVLTNLSQPLQGTHANATLNEEISTENRQQVSLREASELPIHSSGSQGLQGSSVAHFHGNDAKIIPSFKSRLLQVNLMDTKVTNERKQQSVLLSSSPTSSTIGKIMKPKLAKFKPDAPLFHKPAPDMPVRKNTSDAIASNGKSSSRIFRFSPTQRMESNPHQANPAFTNNSERNTAEVIQRQMNPPSLSTCMSLQLQLSNVNSEQRNTTGLHFNAKKKVCTADTNLQHCLDLSCEAESVHMSATEMVTPWLSQGEKENHSGGETGKDTDVIHRSTLNLPNVETNDQEASVPPAEVSTKYADKKQTTQRFTTGDPLHCEKFFKLKTGTKATARKESIKRKQEEGCETKLKKSKTKLAIQDVDIENHAKNNQLSKLNSVTLQFWLKQHGISVKAREKKEKLVSKIMQFINES
ncbi:uncharacterized protein C18orf63 homolog [Microcaecilia unicolor]|uniref:Uncharacterized protein C18orf63 homolog n=1 Tax=Microcaecilia unicolor TaxID=1415580 RepID=A0A6P7YMW0_9AMPH|nr:uncharacterized protein C18orf63 homolog [Microcaecilia unicolor]